MSTLSDISKVRKELLLRFETLENKRDILKSPELKSLIAAIPMQQHEDRAAYGKAVNDLSKELKKLVDSIRATSTELPAIDVTSPFDINAAAPQLLPTVYGSLHPLTQEIERITAIFSRMGFVIEDSREIDDQYHMFESLNFPAGHPARDDYDTFKTVETDSDGEPFVAPAHTSTMQHRMLKKYQANLERDEPIAVVVPDRVFRNEDLDARHEHTFYQIEGVYVSKDVHTGMLIATLQAFLSEYYERKLEIRTNPFYFPFTEPSLEISLSCPFCNKKGCTVCSYAGWIELLGCGMIHPNVLKAADIDPMVYTGFAWGLGIDRLVMMTHGIEDVRHFESAKLDFLRQFP